jgi:Ca-activated chloride channel family protein
MMEVPKMTPNPVYSATSQPHGSADTGGYLVSAAGQALPLTGAKLTARARAGLAEVALEQRFRNPEAVPLAVTYSFPLPADAAVSGYAFAIGDRRITGEIDRRAAARERFEEAVLEGKTAGLVDQERSSLFTQELGNIPPGAEVVVTLTLDQRLRWLDEGAWEWRFPTAAAPRYLGAEGRVGDADRVTQAIADGSLAARIELALAVGDALRPGRQVESPSHRLVAAPDGRLGFWREGGDGSGGVPLDRDVVVRWAVAGPAVGVTIETGSAPASSGIPSAFGLLTLAPPAREAQAAPVARDLVVLLDTSGSMGGEPLDQARRVVSALVETLGERDSLEMIEFSSQPRRWKAEPVAATAAARREALAWLGRLRASGGTEMLAGIVEALAPLRAESQRQVVVVTDGLIGFEAEVVGAIVKKLPPSSRVHTVGVGSSVNRSLTGAVARAGSGVEVVVGLGEDPERAARRIVARTDAPLVVDLALGGSALIGHAPRRLPDLYAGAPALVGLSLRSEGGTLEVSGRTASGEWRQAIAVPPTRAGEGSRAAAKLYARETVEDLETRVAAGEDRAATESEIERVGLAFQIATRLTSWVAISDEPTVDPTAPTKKVRMPQALPHGMSAEGVGLRAAAFGGVHGGIAAMSAAPAERMRGAPSGVTVNRVLGRFEARKAGEPQPPAPTPTAAPRSAAERRLRGRIALRKRKKLVIEFEVAGADLDWKIGREVEVAWADGRRARAKVVKSTRAGRVPAGQQIRLVLELAPDEPAPAQVIVDGGERLVVEV